MDEAEGNPKLTDKIEGDVDSFNNGDLYDEDTGTYFGAIDPEFLKEMPINIGMFLNGVWYIYKLDHKYREGTQNAQEDKDA
jgi:hypothetical protein